LLATYGVDPKGRLFIHVKIYKQQRIYGEVLVTDGTVKLHCRECLRWHTVNIIQPERAILSEDTEPPPELAGDDPAAMLADTGTGP
jgi:hypothetical protein